MMNRTARIVARNLGSVILLTIVCACSSNPYTSQNDTALRSSDGTRPASVIVPITEELVNVQKERRDQQSGNDLQLLVGIPVPYTIGPGDVLSIVVWGHPELVAGNNMAPLPTAGSGQPVAWAELTPQGFVVDHDGMVQFPFAGAVKVSGLTEVGARDLVTSKILQYINHPNVTLRVQSYRSRRVYVAGEVKTPGLQSINDIPMTLVEALNRAGGVLPTADQSRISVNRAGTLFQVNLPHLVEKGIDPGSLLLKSGDVVRVYSRDDAKVFVTGEVTTPKSMTMHDGRLTLNEALGESGGINPLSGDARQVFVIRKVDKQATVFHLDAQSPGAMAIAESFELNPKDMVYVAPNGLTDWHRTISLLFPGELSNAVMAGRPNIP